MRKMKDEQCDVQYTTKRVHLQKHNNLANKNGLTILLLIIKVLDFISNFAWNLKHLWNKHQHKI